MRRIVLTCLLISLINFSKAQTYSYKLSKAVGTVYNNYKLFFDSNMLEKHVVLNTKKSYLVNSRTHKIKTLLLANNDFEFDEFNLTFAIIYKGDTITHLPMCRLDTLQNLMPLGSPANPIRHGDALPPYLELVKGNIPFDYRSLKKLLNKKQVEANQIELKRIDANGEKQYAWYVNLQCPETNCDKMVISAHDGKIISHK